MTDATAAAGFDAAGRGPVRYRRVAGAALSERRSESEGEGAEYFLKTPTGELFVLAEQERFLWQLLDGKRPFGEFERRFRGRFGVRLAPARFAKFLADLIEAGAVEPVPESERGPRVISLDVAEPEPSDHAGDEAAAGPRSAARPGGRGPRRQQRAGADLRAAMMEVWSVDLGNPEKFLNALSAIFWPIRHAFWATIPLFIFATLVYIKHSSEYYHDWVLTLLAVYVLPAFWVTEHICTFSARFVQGAVYHGFGLRSQEVRLKLFMGHFVRIHFDDTMSKQLPRRQQLWLAASPLITRLFYYSIGMIAWWELRPSHAIWAYLALWMSYMGIFSFFISACPLLPLYGCQFLQVLLNQDHLHSRAFSALALTIRGRPVVDNLSLAERWGLVFFGAGTLLGFSLFIGHMFYISNTWMIESFAGLGGWFMAFVFIFSIGYFVSLWRFSRTLRAMTRVDRVRDGARAPAEHVEA